MNINELTIIKTNIKGQLNNKLIAPLVISGSPGTGKSSTVRALAKELNMNIVEFSCPTLTIEFLSGLPNETPIPKFSKALITNITNEAIGTAWSMPEMLTTVWTAAEEKPTILLLDDFHGMAPHLQSYFYQLLLDRKLGNYTLPSNVAIVGTMNDSESAGFSGISSAIRNRLSILKVEFNFDYWLESFGNRLHYLVASFLKTKSHYCMEEETTGVVGYATARAWTAIAAELVYYPDDFILSQASRISGMQVSGEAARAFQTHVNYIAAIDFSKVVKSRELVDLSTKDPLDSIIYSYITNFIQTVDDGLYLFELMNTNINQSSFIGFVFGELYVKYTNSNETPISEGIRFVIDKIIHQPMNLSTYPNTSKEKLTKAFEVPIENMNKFMDYGTEYLN